MVSGGLLDKDDRELKTAFSHVFMTQNKHDARFQLTSDSHPIDNDDSYEVGATSKYMYCPIHTADADETKLSSRVASAVCTQIRN